MVGASLVGLAGFEEHLGRRSLGAPRGEERRRVVLGGLARVREDGTSRGPPKGRHGRRLRRLQSRLAEPLAREGQPVGGSREQARLVDEPVEGSPGRLASMPVAAATTASVKAGPARAATVATVSVSESRDSRRALTASARSGSSPLAPAVSRTS